MKSTLNGPVIPAEAREKVVQRHVNGAKAEAFYYSGRKRVGIRRWSEDGTPLYECATDGKVRHGRWILFRDGVPCLEATYVRGKRHGIRIQYDRSGKVAGTSEFRQGNGVDLWFDHGRLSEEWHYRDDLLHGVERWWLGSRTKVAREGYWFKGRPHGIVRQWDHRGRLKPEFPEFWIHNKRVTQEQYLKACRTDRTLHKFRESENSPRRPFPAKSVASSRRRAT